MTTVLLGNPNPQMQVPHPDPALAALGHRVSAPAEHLDRSVTRVEMRPDFDDPDHVDLTLSTDNDRQLSNLAKALGPDHHGYALGIYEVEQILGVHAAGSKPDWVTSDDPAFAAALGGYFSCPVGEPVAVLANAGRDAIHAQFLGTSAQPAAFFYGALSANTGAGFATSDTTLAGEIATAGGGLIRKAMTYAHTAGTNTSTLSATYTANGSDVLPVTLASWAQFNAVTVGTLAEELVLSPGTATLSVSGDSVTVVFTLTL